MIRVHRGFSLALLLLLLISVAGCSSAPTPGPTGTPAPPPDPQAVLRRAVSELLDLRSAKFVLEHQTGSTTIFAGLDMNKASGVVEIPDRFQLKVEGESKLFNSYVELDVISIEDKAYMTDPGSGRWRDIDVEALPVNLSNLGRTLADIVDAVVDPVLLDTEQLGNRETYHIGGGVQSEDLAALVPGAADGFNVQLELWLDRSDGLLRQVLITGQVVATDIPEVVRLLTLSDFNLPVDISPPE